MCVCVRVCVRERERERETLCRNSWTDSARASLTGNRGYSY